MSMNANYCRDRSYLSSVTNLKCIVSYNIASHALAICYSNIVKSN